MTMRPALAFVLILVCFAWSDCYSQDSSPAQASDSATSSEKPIPVTLKQDKDGGWQLFRAGKPFYVQGVGADGGIEGLAAIGANSTRTWGVDDDTIKTLDAAHAQGLTVSVGLWLGHERHGYDYQDLDSVSKQIENTLASVRKLKNHPAILVWGLGNEMEAFKETEGDSPAIWLQVEHIARMIKQEDPNHPIMTVVAEVGGRKIEAINKLCPSVDIIGINSYGGGPKLPERLAKFESKKPYIVTEFGPAGAWEVDEDDLGIPIEKSSTEKAADYRASYEAFKADSKNCLGCYAFLWGQKVEGTATWFGMLLPDGRKLAAVDTMTELWTGKPPANLCPEIKSFTTQNQSLVEEQASLEFSLEASDPEDDEITVDFVLMEDTAKYMTGGDFQETPPVYPENILKSDKTSALIRMPKAPGLYRVYAYVRDSNKGAAVANIPIRVAEDPGMKTELPHVVFDEADEERVFVMSGFMGSFDAITVDEECATDPKQGKHCMEVKYSLKDNWGGVVWQHPINDWGEVAGGVNFSKAKKLNFWAKGSTGGEVIKFGFGLLGKDAKFSDTTKADTEVTLTKEWKQYSLDLKGDKTRIKSGFYWTLAGQGIPLKFYLDGIEYVGAEEKDEEDGEEDKEDKEDGEKDDKEGE